MLFDIQQKTMAGIFNFVLDKHENFLQSLQRTEANMLRQNAEFKERYEAEFKVTQLLKSQLEYSKAQRNRSKSEIDSREFKAFSQTSAKLGFTHALSASDASSFTPEALRQELLK